MSDHASRLSVKSGVLHQTLHGDFQGVVSQQQRRQEPGQAFIYSETLSDGPWKSQCVCVK